MNKNRYEYIEDGLITKVLVKTAGTIRTIMIDTSKLPLIKEVSIAFKKYGTRYVAQYYREDFIKYNLARLILGVTDNKIFVTFKNHDGLDYREENLILSKQGTVVQNRSGNQINNTSNIRGVYWNVQKSKWCGQVEHKRKNHYVGCSDNKYEIEQKVIAKRNEIHELSHFLKRG